MTTPRTLRSDAGSALLELAVLLPFLLLIVFGMVEGGSALSAGDRVAGAVSQGARVGAASGARAEADRDVLVALRAALPAAELAGLDRVVIYKPTATGDLPAGRTKTLGDPSEQGTSACNTYSGATVRSVSAGSMLGFGGAANNKDGFWPPASRKDSLAAGPDHLGVWVRTVHRGVLGVVFHNLDLTRSSVYRIQPDLTG